MMFDITHVKWDCIHEAHTTHARIVGLAKLSSFDQRVVRASDCRLDAVGRIGEWSCFDGYSLCQDRMDDGCM